jgi:1-acyl-sn-glycerol-3-phosphate acyltransferase
MRDERTPAWKIANVVVGATFHVLFRIRYVDGRNLPTSGGAVLAANHISPLDPIPLAMYPASHRRILRFLSGTEFFAMRWVGRGLRALDHIPLARGKNDTEAIERAMEVARSGGLICLFPEGKINNGPDLLRGRRGTARVAVGAGVPLIPVGIWGTQVRFPGGGWTWRRPWRPTVVVVFGEPIPTDPTATSARDILHLTNELMSRIEELRDRAKDIAGPKGFAW